MAIGQPVGLLLSITQSTGGGGGTPGTIGTPIGLLLALTYSEGGISEPVRRGGGVDGELYTERRPEWKPPDRQKLREQDIAKVQELIDRLDGVKGPKKAKAKKYRAVAKEAQAVRELAIEQGLLANTEPAFGFEDVLADLSQVASRAARDARLSQDALLALRMQMAAYMEREMEDEDIALALLLSS